MNAIPTLQPVTIAAIERPRFDNSRIADKALWELDNAAALAHYWADQGNALNISKDDQTDLEFWLLVQYDIECEFEAARRLPHGSGL